MSWLESTDEASTARIIVSVVLRLALCAAVIGLLWLKLGPTAIALGSPLIAIALAKPIVRLLSDARHAMNAMQYRHIEGRYYAYKGIALDVLEDDLGHRWVRTEDLRRIVDKLPSDAVLERTLPDGCKRFGQPAAAYVKDEALTSYLARATAPETLKFRQWFHGAIANPAKNVRSARPGGARAPSMPDRRED